MSYITAIQLLGAHEVAARAIAHFQQTGDSAHPDTDTTFFPAPNHRIRNSNNKRQVKHHQARKFTGPRFPKPITRAIESPEETPNRTDCSCEHCTAFHAAKDLEHGVAAVNDSALVKKPELNAAAAEFVPVADLDDAAAAEFVLAVAIAGFAATVANTPVTDIRSLWDDSTDIDGPSDPTALFAPIITITASIQQTTNAAATRRSSIASNVSASETLFDIDPAVETSSAITTPRDAFRQLSDHEIAHTAQEYGIDLEDLEMHGRELIGWERLIEEEL